MHLSHKLYTTIDADARVVALSSSFPSSYCCGLSDVCRRGIINPFINTAANTNSLSVVHNYSYTSIRRCYSSLNIHKSFIPSFMTSNPCPLFEVTYDGVVHNDRAGEVLEKTNKKSKSEFTFSICRRIPSLASLCCSCQEQVSCETIPLSDERSFRHPAF